MVTAYVMVKANTGEADRLKSEMVGLDGVESVNIVAGDVDFIVKVSVDQPAQVKEIVADHIQAIDGVEDTQTYISMD
ncbi:Lrp/AsnC family transcriptional regulator [Halobium salinum]|uniref:Lrp/AsnC family transcriptional regulator n=1 Tax=Halobium salinum TaxID=1364940 RepID=A0ABD5P9P2_9EURY|nr:Lrp/AsnC family transcriptional regulator [Halobium salinum]